MVSPHLTAPWQFSKALGQGHDPTRVLNTFGRLVDLQCHWHQAMSKSDAVIWTDDVQQCKSSLEPVRRKLFIESMTQLSDPNGVFAQCLSFSLC